jgi:GTP-binding protein EngB required for normal cell division
MNTYHLTVLCTWLLFAAAVLSKQDTDEIWQISTQRQEDFCRKFKNLCSEAKVALKMVKKNGLKIALIGNSGVGKSSLVNALTNCAHDSKTCDYAKSCGSDECTEEAESYRHATIPNLDYVDLPGVGTKKFPWESKSDCSFYYIFSKYPQENYYQYMELESYDAIILVSAERPTIFDGYMYREIREKEAYKVVFFVRNKVDIAFERAKYDRISHEDVLSNARNSLKNFYNLLNDRNSWKNFCNLLNDPIYLIDAHDRSEEFRPYNDLNRLKADIISSLASIAAINYEKKLI